MLLHVHTPLVQGGWVGPQNSRPAPQPSVRASATDGCWRTERSLRSARTAGIQYCTLLCHLCAHSRAPTPRAPAPVSHISSSSYHGCGQRPPVSPRATAARRRPLLALSEASNLEPSSRRNSLSSAAREKVWKSVIGCRDVIACAHTASPGRVGGSTKLASSSTAVRARKRN